MSCDTLTATRTAGKAIPKQHGHSLSPCCLAVESLVSIPIINQGLPILYIIKSKGGGGKYEKGKTTLIM